MLTKKTLIGLYNAQRSNNGSTVKLSKEFIEEARILSKAFNRSFSGQIEHCAKIGKLAEENPDITYDLINDILISMSEDEGGMREPYELGS